MGDSSITVPIPTGWLRSMGMSEEAVREKAEEIIGAADEFGTNEVRPLELTSVPLAKAAFSLPATYQFIGIQDGQVWFIRAGRTSTEAQNAAIDEAIQVLANARADTVAEQVQDEMNAPIDFLSAINVGDDARS